MRIAISKAVARDTGDDYSIKGISNEVTISEDGIAKIELKWSDGKLKPFATVYLDSYAVWEIVMGMIKQNCERVMREVLKEFMSKEDE